MIAKSRVVEKMRSVCRDWKSRIFLPVAHGRQCEVMVDMAYPILHKVSIIKAQGEPRRLLGTSFVSGISNCNTPESWR